MLAVDESRVYSGGTESIKFDDSLTLTLEHTELEDKSNWLPVPDGPFALALRIYWPEQDILDGKWTPSPIRRMEKHVGRVSYPPSGGTLRVEICPTCSGSHPHRTAP